MIDKALRHKSVMDCQSFPAIASLGKSLDPIPTQVTPALNQADRFSSVGSTAPVAMIRVHGMGAFMFLTNEGPPTFPAGNILQRSQPVSWAKPISDTEPQPGV